MSKGVGITAIRRVIEDTCRRRVADENERRAKGRSDVIKSIVEWATTHSPLSKAVIPGLHLEINHPLMVNNPYSYYCGGENLNRVAVKLTPVGGRDKFSGSISTTLTLPAELSKAAQAVRELRIEDMKSTSELLASRVILKGEGGNIEKHIAQVVDAWVREMAK